jgi:FkbM family methyltransferase
MLISFEEINNILLSKKIEVHGAFHIGAHDCEEMKFYNNIGLPKENIVWIDALPSKVEQAIQNGIPNVYNAVITDKDDHEVVFHISNNGLSSSVLELGTHTKEHPEVFYQSQMMQNTITIDTFFERNQLDASKFNFWNFDIQGAELMALKGSTQTIQYAKVIYLEVNVKELYKSCGMIDEVDAFLSAYKFKRVLTKMTPHGWGDALYILDA